MVDENEKACNCGSRLQREYTTEEVGKTPANGQLERMIDEYQSLILSVCYKMTQDYFAAQDLTQETFLSAYEHLDGFDGTNEKSWLCRIASNKCIDYMRRAANHHVPMEDEQMEQYQSKLGRPEHETLEEVVSEELLQNCGKLKPPYDEIARLYFYKEKTAEEIAFSMNKKVKTIQTQIYRARDMLRKLYEKEHRSYFGGRNRKGKERCHE